LKLEAPTKAREVAFWEIASLGRTASYLRRCPGRRNASRTAFAALGEMRPHPARSEVGAALNLQAPPAAVPVLGGCRNPIPIKPGSIAKQDNEYERCGTPNVFCGIEPKAGIHFTKVTPDRPLSRGAKHRSDNGQRVFPRRQSATGTLRRGGGGALWDRFTVHYTPKHGSWWNQAELEIGLFSRRCLGKRRIKDIRKLRSEARAWNRRINRNRTTINWTFDRKKATKKFRYKYKTKRSKTRGVNNRTSRGGLKRQAASCSTGANLKQTCPA
jgi:hypothetical protein